VILIAGVGVAVLVTGFGGGAAEAAALTADLVVGLEVLVEVVDAGVSV
jgi:PII-like signaling protein